MYSETLFVSAASAGLLLAVSIAVIRTTASMRDEMESVADIRSEVEQSLAAQPDVREVRATRLFKQASDRYYGEVEFLPAASDRPSFMQIILFRDQDGRWSWREA